MNWIFLVLLFSLSQLRAQAGTQKTHELTHDKIKRSYVTYEPAGLDKNSYPMMLVLHGGTGNADHSMKTMGFEKLADQEKLLIVYANGTETLFGENRRVWNAGDCCGAAVRKNIDDVGFIEKMLSEIKINYKVDRKRIYVIGMSNGAMMTYRLICELPNTFAAAIPVAGTLVTSKKCEHGAETALMHIHGMKDESVPFEGGRGKGLARMSYQPLMRAIDKFSKMKNCGEPKITTKSNGDEILDYSCGASPPIKLVKIKNLIHAWPGGSGRRAQTEIDYSAPFEAWNFAKNFKL